LGCTVDKRVSEGNAGKKRVRGESVRHDSLGEAKEGTQKLALPPTRCCMESLYKMTEPASESSAPVPSDFAVKHATKILHVDDDLSFLKVAKQCLEIQGKFQVDTASSVEQAMEKMQNTDYDAVVCDYQLSGKDGLEFLKELRQKGDAIPFIVFTGRGREEVVVRALNLGADHYLNKLGDPAAVYSELANDIRQAVKARLAELRLRSTLDNMLEGCQIIDYTWRYIYVNDAVARQGRVSKKGLLGKTMMQVYPGIEKTEMFATLRRCMEERVTERMLNEFEFPGGQKGWFELSIQPVPEGIFILSIDVTEREEARERMTESEKKYSELFETSVDGIVAADMNLHILDCNEAFQKMLSYSKEELKELTIRQLTPRRWHKMEAGVMQEQLMKKAYSAEYEKELRRKDGSVFPVSVREWLTTNEDGKPKGTWRIVRDITERKRSTRELFDKQIRLQNIFAAFPFAITVVDLNGNIIECNEQAQKVFEHLSRDEAVGRSVFEFIAEKDRQRATENMKKTLKQGLMRNMEHAIVLQDGGESLASVSASVFKDVSGKRAGFVIVIDDITERKKARKCLGSQKKGTRIFSRT
jgi:PAS domain S-box-containing protein